MSLLGKLAAFFSGGAARKVCVVDGDRLVGGDRVGPGERFQALSKLARFAEREALDVRVVFGGRPLREADDGAVFHGVTVYYGENAANVRERIAKALSSVGCGKGLLVTGDQALESEMSGKGYATMRITTLRKAMEPAQSEGGEREGGGGFRDRDRDRDRDGGRRGRNRGRGGRRGPNESREQQPAAADGAENPAPTQRSNEQGGSSGGGGGNSNDSVKNLIDLVE